MGLRKRHQVWKPWFTLCSMSNKNEITSWDVLIWYFVPHAHGLLTFVKWKCRARQGSRDTVSISLNIYSSFFDEHEILKDQRSSPLWHCHSALRHNFGALFGALFSRVQQNWLNEKLVDGVNYPPRARQIEKICRSAGVMNLRCACIKVNTKIQRMDNFLRAFVLLYFIRKL